MKQRGRDHDLLPHPVGEASGLLMGSIAQFEHLQKLLSPVFGPFPIHAVEVGHEHEELPCCQLLIHVGLVRNVTHDRLRALRLSRDVNPAQARNARCRSSDSDEHVDGCRFPRPVWAQEPEDLSCVHLKIHIIDGEQVAVAFGQTLCSNQSPSLQCIASPSGRRGRRRAHTRPIPSLHKVWGGCGSKSRSAQAIWEKIHAGPRECLVSGANTLLYP